MLLVLLFTLATAAAPSGAAAVAVSDAPVSDADIERLAVSFAKALETESVLSFEPLSANGITGFSWLSVREVLDRVWCFDIRTVRVSSRRNTPRGTEVELELFMTARRSGTPREVTAPSHWMLTVVSTPQGPRIAAAATAERHFAQRLVATSSPAERTELLQHAFALGSRELFNEIAGETIDAVFAASDGDDLEVRSRAFYVAEAMAEMAAATDDFAIEALALRSMATLRRIDQTKPMLPYARAAHDAALRSGDCDLIAATLFTLGSTMHEEGEPGGPTVVRRAGAMADSLDDPRIALRALYNAAAFEVSRDPYTAAATSAELIEKAGRARYASVEANGFTTLGLFHLELGDHETAARYFLRSYARHLGSGRPDLAAYASHSAGIAAYAAGDRESALPFLRRALQLAKSDDLRGTVAAELAVVLLDLGRNAEAECLLDAVRSPGNGAEFQSTQYYYARARLLRAGGRLGEALTHATLSSALAPSESRWHGGRLASQILRDLGRREEAWQLLDDALAQIEEQRTTLPRQEWLRARFFGDRALPYYEQADLLVELGRPREALEVAEHAKARSLIDAMQLQRAQLPMRPEERARLDDVTARITARNRELLIRRAKGAPAGDIEAELDSLQREYDRVQTEVAIRARRNEGVAERFALTDVTSATRRDTAQLEFLVGAERTTVFLVLRDHAGKIDIRTRQVPTAEVKASVTRLLRAVRGRSSDEPRAAAAVYDLLLGPFDALARTRDSLHIVPDGILWQVPFHALRDRYGEVVAGTWDVAYAQSLTALALAQSKRRPIDTHARIAAFGNPEIVASTATRARAEFRDFTLAPLPDAADEVRAIGKMYEGAQVFVGRDAGEDALKRSSAESDILHIATHGMVDDARPLHSALVFAPSEHEDGLLEARELLQLDIDARLAILSACDTARGATSAGEGVVSLSWALQVAGCPTTVVSLWKADSRAASLLMIAFHRALVRGVSIPKALQAAQEELRQDPRFAHPFYWAPFVVIGAP